MYGVVIRHVHSLSQVVSTHKTDNMSYQVLTFEKVHKYLAYSILSII